MRIELYQSNPVSFDFSDQSKMVNATQMAKPFNKRPSNFLQLDTVQEYIKALEEQCWDSSIGKTSNMYYTVHGGTPDKVGTWMHYKLALRFAQWLNPNFAVWVDSKIEELLKTGQVSLLPDFSNPAQAARAWADEFEQKQIAQTKLKELEPVVETYEAVMSSKGLVSIGDTAKILAIPNLGPNNLFSFLREQKILLSTNTPYQEYVNKGWFKCIETTYKAHEDDVLYIKTMVTPKGVEEINKLVKQFKNESSRV